MRQYLKKELVVPRWFLWAVLILAIVSFATIYIKAHELYLGKYWAEIELSKERLYFKEIFVLDPPIWAPIANFVEMQIGFLCSLGIVVGTIWILCRGRRSPNE